MANDEIPTNKDLVPYVDQSHSALGTNAIQAGRDVVVHQDSIDHSLTFFVKEHFEKQHLEDATDIFQRLQHYLSPNEKNDKIEGLELKLKSAGRDHLLEYAESLKHDLSKKLEKIKFSKSGQTLYLYLLENCYDRFKTYVTPAIASGAGNEEIDKVFYENVIKPIVQSIGENPLGIMNNDIKSLTYYLTGNCHLRWD